jgi:hypothetical protein
MPGSLTRQQRAQVNAIKRRALEAVQAARPWRFTQTGLKRYLRKEYADSRDESPQLHNAAVAELFREGKLQEQYRERARGLKVRIALPDPSAHALPESDSHGGPLRNMDDAGVRREGADAGRPGRVGEVHTW